MIFDKQLSKEANKRLKLIIREMEELRELIAPLEGLEDAVLWIDDSMTSISNLEDNIKWQRKTVSSALKAC